MSIIDPRILFPAPGADSSQHAQVLLQPGPPGAAAASILETPPPSYMESHKSVMTHQGQDGSTCHSPCMGHSLHSNPQQECLVGVHCRAVIPLKI